MRKIEYEEGHIFGNCTYIKDLRTENGVRIACFKCGHCSKEFEARLKQIRTGNKSCCGCKTSEWLSRPGLKHGYTKGKSKTPEYHAWVKMKQRCTNPNDRRYPDYGGRGIKVCERWLISFENFIEDIGNRPSKNHSLDRIDVNGNYEPSNCRWGTVEEQANNKRTNVLLTYNGKTQTMQQWMREILSHNPQAQKQLERYKLTPK